MDPTPLSFSLSVSLVWVLKLQYGSNCDHLARRAPTVRCIHGA